MTTERADLTARVLPQITLGTGAPGDLTAPPSPFPTSMTPAERAHERFRLGGNAIVTGGAGDLGSAVSKALLEHGLQGLSSSPGVIYLPFSRFQVPLLLHTPETSSLFTVLANSSVETVIFDMDPVEGEAKVSLLETEFPDVRIRFLKVDITDEAAVDAAVAQTVSLLGPVTTLLNFAGIVSCGHALDWTSKDWNRVLNVNTIGSFFVARAVARHIIAHKTGGSMVFVASISAHQVNFPQPQVLYNVSKAGVKAMVRSLAAEWARYGIRVNSISPGYMDTILNEGDGLEEARRIWLSRHPLGRMGQPDELCGVVVMLASRAGSYLNGSDSELLSTPFRFFLFCFLFLPFFETETSVQAAFLKAQDRSDRHTFVRPYHVCFFQPQLQITLTQGCCSYSRWRTNPVYVIDVLEGGAFLCKGRFGDVK